MDDGFSSSRSHWLAGELAKAAGVSRDTLRHYERKGVLARPRRAANGYRLYDADALKRVQLVRRALSVGFTLDELARVLSEREKGGAPCRKVRALVAGKLADVERQIGVLTALGGELRATLTGWDARLSETAPAARAGLLEELAAGGQIDAAAAPAENSSPNLKFRRKKESEK